MRSFSLSAKLFTKSPPLLVIYGVFVAFLHAWLIRTLCGVSSYRLPAFDFLSETLRMSLLCTAFFLFFAYELFRKAQAVGLAECLAATKRGRGRLFGCQCLLLALLVAAVAVTGLFYNLIYPEVDLRDGAYLAHAACCIFFYLFLVPLTGGLLGACAALFCKRLSGYLWMTAFLLLSSPLAGLLSYTVADATRYQVDPAPLFDIFNLYPPNLDFAPVYAFGISLLPDRWEAVLFWLFVAGIGILLRVLPPSSRAVKLAPCGCAALCLLLLAAFWMPASKIDLSYRVDGTLFSDRTYYDALYEDGYPAEQPADFRVTHYDLNLSVKNQLHATANVQLDDPGLPSYVFTLSHDFRLKTVTAQDGTPLRFVREDDHVEVFSDGRQVTQIAFGYVGSNTRFYSNRQGVFLPGYFAYYPIPGRRNVYASDLQSYAKNRLPDEVDFRLTVRAGQEVFTNLSPAADGSFTGKTNGVTVLAGFFRRTTVQGIEVVYPYFNTEEYDPAELSGDIADFCNVKGDDPVRKVLVVPGVNQGADSVVAFSDHFTAEQARALDDSYIFTKMLDFKQFLYDDVRDYRENRAAFDESVAAEQNFPPQVERHTTMLFEKIQELGEETVLEQADAYIFDNDDNRSIAEFLDDLGKENAR